MDIIEITWKDAINFPNILNKKAISEKTYLIVKTVGYRVEENEEKIVVAFHKNSKGDFRYVNIIPKESVIKITPLKEDKVSSLK